MVAKGLDRASTVTAGIAGVAGIGAGGAAKGRQKIRNRVRHGGDSHAQLGGFFRPVEPIEPKPDVEYGKREQDQRERDKGEFNRGRARFVASQSSVM